MPSLSVSSPTHEPPMEIAPHFRKFDYVSPSADYSLVSATSSKTSFRSAWPPLEDNEMKEPCLISLSPGNSQLEYHLQSGVTMLGTGKGCVKPPEIILQGAGVAPQHCFIERLNRLDEVILQPISDLTKLDGQKVSGPTPLRQGNIIQVGDTNLLAFQHYNKSALDQAFRMGEREQSFVEFEVDPSKECPYAVVIKQKGTTSNLNTTGDVNKTSSCTMDKSFSSPTPYNQCHSNNNAQRQRHPLWRQNSVEDDYYDNCPNENDHGHNDSPGLLVIGQTAQKYRDGLESDNFENKVARFEFLAAHRPHPENNGMSANFEFGQQNGRCPVPVLPHRERPLPNPPSSTNGFPKSMSSSYLENKRRRPSPYFSRFGTNSEFRYFSDESRTWVDDSNSNYIVQSTKAVPTIGYRRTHSLSYASSPNEIMPLIRSNTVDDSTHCSKAFGQPTQSSQSSNSFSLQSSPSPDSVYSSHSSDGSFTSFGNFRSTPLDLRNVTRESKNSPVVSEELSDFPVVSRTPEERHFSCRKVPSMGEASALDEVLAICEEYEQQIAREIEGKHSSDLQKPLMTNEEDRNKASDIGRSLEYSRAMTPALDHISNGSASTEESESRGQMSHDLAGYLPSDFKRNADARNQFFSTPQLKTQLSLPCHKSNAMLTGIKTSDNWKSLEFDIPNPINYRYENIGALENTDSSLNHNSLSAQVPTTPSDFVDGPRPSSLAQNIQNGQLPELAQKSKLSVSFSPSVEEYNMDDYIPRVSSANSSPKSNTELTSRLKSSTNSNSSRTVDTKAEIHSTDDSHDGIDSPSKWDAKTLSSAKASSPIQVIQEACQVVETLPTVDVIQFAEVAEVPADPPASLSSHKTEDLISRLKSQIRDLEQQEMEALREMEMEKALLQGEEESMERQLFQSKSQLEEMRNRLCQIDGGIRLWKVASSQELSAMKRKLSACERNLQRLEKMHEDFCGTTDEETNLLEKLKYQHELIEVERKVFEDAEFQQMEETASKEAQRDELTNLFGETKRKLAMKQFELEQLRQQNRASLAASVKEIHKLENQRQSLITEHQECQQSVKSDSLSIPESSYFSSNSDSDEIMIKNCDLEEKLKSLTLLAAATDDAMTIEMMKSNSPIDPKLGIFGSKTSETLREIEKYREFLLNEQGIQILEEERQRVKELQKRVQAAVREEWEAARKNRNNQCNSLNSVGSEDSSQTISDTPTDSGSSDDGPDKGRVVSFGKTELTSQGNSNAFEQTAFELCQQMRQRQKDMSQTSSDDTTPRPVSDGSAYDNRHSIVTLREKHSLQNNRPLTRYLPVRGDEDHFDLRGHIESSGHQLSLCPQLVLTSTVAKGSLLKLGSRFHNWNKRWFVFDRETRTLSYYIDKTQKKPRGGIHFQAIQEVYVDHLQSVKSPAPKLTFCVKTYNRIFHLVAPSPEAMRIWVDIIFTGAEGYQEFKSTA